MTKDPNLIYPGSDLTNVFPEEGTDITPTQVQVMRNALIQRCARVADDLVDLPEWRPIAEPLAAAIRALKDKP